MVKSSESSFAAMEMVEGQNRPEVDPKEIKFQEIVVEMEEDRISALPDCLLVEILSRLPSTKDAIRAGTLSKRWEHLWTLVSTLIFQLTDCNSKQPMSDFASSLSKTLVQCRQLKLKKFDVFTMYFNDIESQVNEWIRYAISCNVEELLLKLWPILLEAKIQLDQSLYISSCFTHLTLRGCSMNPTGEITWKNLRSLYIYSMELDEDLIENILTGSPQLETLVLLGCYGYKRLDITSKSVKKLVFDGFYVNPSGDIAPVIIKINAPNILSLTIKSDLFLWKVLLENVSSLVEANLDHYETKRGKKDEKILKGIIQKLSHVKHLRIGGVYFKVLSRLEAKGFVVPSNIGKLPDDFPRYLL